MSLPGGVGARQTDGFCSEVDKDAGARGFVGRSQRNGTHLRGSAAPGEKNTCAVAFAHSRRPSVRPSVVVDFLVYTLFEPRATMIFYLRARERRER